MNSPYSEYGKKKNHNNIINNVAGIQMINEIEPEIFDQQQAYLVQQEKFLNNQPDLPLLDEKKYVKRQDYQ